MNGNVKIDIPLTIVGCDFRAAATAFRESLVTDPEARERLFRAIQGIDPSAGFLALETCNRMEWIVSTEHPDWMAELLKARMSQVWEEAFPGLKEFPTPSIYASAEAIRHLFQVVVGKESLAVGEAQIAGQFQDALKKAQAEKTSSPILNRLGTSAGRLAKAGYRVGFRSNHRQGIHGLVELFLKQQWKGSTVSKDQPRQVVVVGMGSIGRKTAHLLEECAVYRVTRVNRTIQAEHQNIWRGLDQLPELSKSADAIVMATGGLSPVLNKNNIALDGRDRSLLVMDIGIPRQTAAGIQKSDRVHYRNIDDLLELPQKMEVPQDLERIDCEIRKEMESFTRFCMERDMVLLLDQIHRGSQEFVHQRIPSFVESELGELDERTRKQLEDAMKRFIREYAHDIHSALQTALEEYWGQK